MCRDCLQHVGAVPLAAMLRGQAEVEQWGVVGEVLQHDESDAASPGVDPIRGMVGITEAAIVDPALDVGSWRSPGHVERKLVDGQELGELSPVNPAVIESDEGDLHCSNHVSAQQSPLAAMDDVVEGPAVGLAGRSDGRSAG